MYFSFLFPFFFSFVNRGKNIEDNERSMGRRTKETSEIVRKKKDKNKFSTSSRIRGCANAFHSGCCTSFMCTNTRENRIDVRNSRGKFNWKKDLIIEKIKRKTSQPQFFEENISKRRIFRPYIFLLKYLSFGFFFLLSFFKNPMNHLHDIQKLSRLI